MLYFLSLLSDGGDIFNLFRYITFRAGGAFFTSLIIFFSFGCLELFFFLYFGFDVTNKKNKRVD